MFCLLIWVWLSDPWIDRLAWSGRAGPVSASGYETVGRPERPEAQGYETEGRPEKPEAQGYETVGRPEGPEAQGYETLFGGTAVGGRSLLKPYGPLNATQY